MNTSYTTTNGVGVCPRYFRSFAPYEIPFRPDEPVEDFADTEGLKSFYRAYFDSEVRVRQFDKLLLVRAEKEEREIVLSAKELPGSAVYFAVLRDPQPGVGKQLTYSNTEQLAEFFTGAVESSGQTCRAVLFQREIAFSDTYDYWPNGRLRTRTMTKKDHPPLVVHFNDKGRPVTASVS